MTEQVKWTLPWSWHTVVTHTALYWALMAQFLKPNPVEKLIKPTKMAIFA